jgi:outer membrane usher protein FimD/PapC
MKPNSSSVSKKMFTPVFKVNTKVDLMQIRFQEDNF